MRQKVTVTKTLTSSADAVWRVISDGTRVERWFEWVAETEVQDPGEGGIRIIRMKDGTSFEEFITLNDARTRTYQYYAPDPPLPVKDVIGTKRFDIGPKNEVVLTWFVTMDVTAGAPPDIVSTMRDLYAAAMTKIDDLAKAG